MGMGLGLGSDNLGCRKPFFFTGAHPQAAVPALALEITNDPFGPKFMWICC